MSQTVSIWLVILVAFFAAYGKAGIYWATGVLMAATVVALVASWRLLGKVSAVPVVTAVVVVVPNKPNLPYSQLATPM